MKIENKDVILEYDKDYEFIRLMLHIVKMKYGDVTIKVKNAKPYQVVETQKSFLLSKDALKDSEDYGD